MGLLKQIKKDAMGNRTKIQDAPSRELEQLLNRLFYLPKNIDEETAFVKHVMTRGLEQQERVGLHASALIASDNKFCVREQVLSLIYRQNQGEQFHVGLLRIFEEGNAIHEKWQRLFIRGGYAKALDCDTSRMNKDYMISFTPDIIATIPEVSDEPMVVEIKSMNSFAYKKQARHVSGQKQLQWYLYLTGLNKGFVLAESKNDQEFRVELVDYDKEEVIPMIERAEETKYNYNRLIKHKKMVPRPSKRHIQIRHFVKLVQ